MTTRRNFLGLFGALVAAPAVGALTPAAPKHGRGTTRSIFHLDEAGFFPVHTGFSGQVLVTDGKGGVYWQDPDNFITFVMKPPQDIVFNLHEKSSRQAIFCSEAS